MSQVSGTLPSAATKGLKIQNEEHNLISDEATLSNAVQEWLDSGPLSNRVLDDLGREPGLDQALANWLARRGQSLNPFRTGTVQPCVLEELSRSDDIKLRQYVGVAPNAPHSVMRRLAADPDSEVRMWVAENWNAPIDVLEALAEDEDEEVRSSVQMTCAGLLSDGGPPLEGEELQKARDRARELTLSSDYWDL